LNRPRGIRAQIGRGASVLISQSVIPMHSSVNSTYGLLRVPRRRRIPRFPLSDAFNRRSVEALVTQAYFQLIRVTWSEGGSRSVSLAKYGSYDVRLVERKSGGADAPHLWVELRAKDAGAPIEARGCDDLEAAVTVAEQVMTKAERLQNDILSKRNGRKPDSTNQGG
jgi:hypothetical protein